jgi:carboxylesterase type B
VEAVDDEEAFLTEHPLQAVQARKFHRIPWMAGVTADEGLISAVEFIKSEENMKAFEDNWTENVLRTFGIPENTPNSKDKADKLKNLYFPKKDEPFTKEKKLKQYTQLFTDSHFLHHASYNYWVQKPYAPVYLYYFNRPGPSIAPILVTLQDRFHPIIEVGIFLAKRIFGNIVGSQPQNLGVCHGDDLAMLFNWEGLFNVEKDESSLDYKFSKDMVKLWVQFATNDSAMEIRGVKWAKQRHTPGRLSYLELCETPKVIQEPFEERMDKLTYILKLW